MEAEKESAEEEEELHQGAVNYQDFPIMHWEDLALRIAELEKLEQERARVSYEDTTTFPISPRNFLSLCQVLRITAKERLSMKSKLIFSVCLCPHLNPHV